MQDLRFHILDQDTAHMLVGADVFDNPVDPDQCAGFIADAGHMMVFATLADRVVGMASGTVLRHPDKQPALFVNEVGVDEERKSGGWWEWNPSKSSLEYLWRTGRLCICHRKKFQKVYDLTSNVIPAGHLEPMESLIEAAAREPASLPAFVPAACSVTSYCPAAEKPQF